MLVTVVWWIERLEREILMLVVGWKVTGAGLRGKTLMAGTELPLGGRWRRSAPSEFWILYLRCTN